MRQFFVVTACLCLAACGQNKVADTANATPGWTHAKSADEVSLTSEGTDSASTFRLVCAKAGPALTAAAAQSQVGIANMASPFALVVGGGTFPAERVAGSDVGQTFSVSLPVTADVLAAVRDTTTARIFVNDGYAFAESDIDPGQEFENFVTACSALTGVAAKH